MEEVTSLVEAEELEKGTVWLRKPPKKAFRD
jgi:hypothetical protein